MLPLQCVTHSSISGPSKISDNTSNTLGLCCTSRGLRNCYLQTGLSKSLKVETNFGDVLIKSRGELLTHRKQFGLFLIRTLSQAFHTRTNTSHSLEVHCTSKTLWHPPHLGIGLGTSKSRLHSREQIPNHTYCKQFDRFLFGTFSRQFQVGKNTSRSSTQK